MRIGSLFSGIGGLELGLERAGLGETVWQVEQDDFCRKVLAKHWPGADRSVIDVRAAGVDSLSPVELICGGFPCQDVSSAGAGAGLAGARSGLWFEYLRIVRELRPAIVVVENVASGAKRWLCEVRGNLHAVGYATRAFAISAADVGAPHLRRRIFVVATDAFGVGVRLESRRREREDGSCSVESTEHGQARASAHIDGESKSAFAVNAEVGWSYTTRREGPRFGSHEGWTRFADGSWRPPVSGLVPVVHGLSGGVAGRNRRERIRALGNAVVPAQAEAVGRVIANEVGRY